LGLKCTTKNQLIESQNKSIENNAQNKNYQKKKLLKYESN